MCRYHKKLAVFNATKNGTVPLPVRPFATPRVPTKVDALIARWSKPVPTPNATTDANGTITVPAVAIASKARSAPVSVMHSFYDNGTLLSVSLSLCLSGLSVSLCLSVCLSVCVRL